MKRLVVLPTIIKSMFYQANWNVENMQGTGFAWLAKDLFRRNNVEFPKDKSFSASEYFNTNPYLITFILGMMLREVKDNGKIGAYDVTYASALAALGDSFFWHSLRPFTFFVSVCVAMIDPNLAVVIYLILYNSFHLGFRFIGFYFGYNLGRNVILLFRKIAFNKWTTAFDSCSVFMAGVLFSASVKLSSGGDPFIILKALITFVAGLYAARKLPAPFGLMALTGILGVMLLAGV